MTDGFRDAVDLDALEEELRDLYPGDRVKIEWESQRAGSGTVSAKGCACDKWSTLHLDPDDRDRDLVVRDQIDTDDDLLVRSVGDGADVVLGDLVSVRVLERGEESRRADPLTDPETTPDLDDDLETIVLVGCGNAKADEPRPAKDLYTSNYFSLKRQYAEKYGDEWAILSAEYGLLDPDAEVPPYDTVIDDVDFNEWEISVLDALPDVSDVRVVLLAGPDYVEDLESDLFMYGADVETPTAGEKIGQRMSWLSDQLDDEDDAIEDDPGEVDVDPELEPYLEDAIEVINGKDRVRDLEGRLSGGLKDSDVELEIVSDTVVAIVDGSRYEVERLDGDEVDEIETDSGTDGGLDDEEIEADGAGTTSTAPVEEPEPPEGAPKYVSEGLEKQDPETLRQLAEYAEELADHKEAETERELEEDAVEIEDVPEEWEADAWEETVESSNAPASATLTTKEIDGRRYYYYQWREGSKIKSEYVAPVDPADSDS